MFFSRSTNLLVNHPDRARHCPPNRSHRRDPSRVTQTSTDDKTLLGTLAVVRTIEEGSTKEMEWGPVTWGASESKKRRKEGSLAAQDERRELPCESVWEKVADRCSRCRVLGTIRVLQLCAGDLWGREDCDWDWEHRERTTDPLSARGDCRESESGASVATGRRKCVPRSCCTSWSSTWMTLTPTTFPLSLSLCEHTVFSSLLFSS